MKKAIPLIISLISAGGMAAYIYFADAERTAIHFNAFGQADVFAPKWSLLWLAAVPVILSIVYIIYRAVTRGKENIQKNARYEDAFIPAIILLLAALVWVAGVPSLKGGTELQPMVISAMCAVFGCLMTCMANIMAKLKPNKTFGLRTRGTLRDDTVWKRAHRLGGYTGVVGGLSAVVCGIVGIIVEQYAYLLAGVGIGLLIVLGAFVPMIYSDILYARLHKRDGAAGE